MLLSADNIRPPDLKSFHFKTTDNVFNNPMPLLSREYGSETFVLCVLRLTLQKVHAGRVGPDAL